MAIGKALKNVGRAVGRAVSSAVQFKVGIVTGNPGTIARAGVNLVRDSVRLMGALDKATSAIFERASSSQTVCKPGMEGQTSMQLLEALQPTALMTSSAQAQRLLEGLNRPTIDPPGNSNFCGTGLIGLDGNNARPVGNGSAATNSSAASGSSGAGNSTGAAGGAGSTGSGGEVSATDGESLYRLFEENPAAFQEAWKGMNDSDRQMAMMQLQREMQMIQQLTTMMTNIQQTQHSATMAVARNLSV